MKYNVKVDLLKLKKKEKKKRGMDLSGKASEQ